LLKNNTPNKANRHKGKVRARGLELQQWARGNGRGGCGGGGVATGWAKAGIEGNLSNRKEAPACIAYATSCCSWQVYGRK